MINFLEKQIERQIKISTLINEDLNSVNVLSNKLGVIEKTIEGDIEDFNQKFSPARIDILDNKKVSLYIPSDMSLSDLFSNILSSSITIKVLKQILEKEPTLKHLSEEIYLSETSIRRVITRVNNYFVDQDLDIEISILPKLCIHGSERDIRAFFCQMYLEIYDRNSLPMYALIYDALANCFELFAENDSYRLSVNLKLIFFILIGLIRIGNKHYMEKNQNYNVNEEMINKLYTYLSTKTVMGTEFSRYYNFTINKENIQDILSINVVNIGPNIVKQDLLNIYEKRMYEITSQLLTKYFQEVDLSFLITEKKKSDFYKIVALSSDRNSFKVNYYDIFYHQIIKRTPWIVERFEKEFLHSDLSATININSSRLKEIFVELYMQTEELIEIVEPPLKDKSVLIMFDSSESVEKMYQKIIKQRYPFLNTLDIYSKNSLKVDYFYLNNYDIILSENNLDREKFSSEFLKISKVPTDNFWKHFQSKLY